MATASTSTSTPRVVVVVVLSMTAVLLLIAAVNGGGAPVDACDAGDDQYVGAPRGPLHAGRSKRAAPRGPHHGGVADLFNTDVRSILMVL